MSGFVSYVAGLILLALSAGQLSAADNISPGLPAEGLWVIAENGMELRLDNSTVSEAALSTGPTGQYLVTFKLKASAGQAFAELTQVNLGKLMRVVLDGRVLLEPRIYTPITGGTGVLSMPSKDTAEAVLAALEEEAL